MPVLPLKQAEQLNLEAFVNEVLDGAVGDVGPFGPQDEKAACLAIEALASLRLHRPCTAADRVSIEIEVAMQWNRRGWRMAS
jgi:hypothetical protein